jgi:hypothetical protein
MFDHITLRVPDLAAAGSVFSALLDQLEIEQTASTPTFSVWGDFALTQTDAEHPVARRVQIAFTAPTTAHVDRFTQTGSGVGCVDGTAGEARPDSIGYAYEPFSTTRPATASAPSIGTARERRATSISSPSASPISRRQPRSTRRSGPRPASHSCAEPPTAPPSPSELKAAPCS